MINTGHIGGKVSKQYWGLPARYVVFNSIFLCVIMCWCTKNFNMFHCYSFHLRVTREVKNNLLQYSLYAVYYHDNTIKLSFSLYLYLTLSKTTSNARVKSTSYNRRNDKWLHNIRIILKEIQQQQTNKTNKMEEKKIQNCQMISDSVFFQIQFKSTTWKILPENMEVNGYVRSRIFLNKDVMSCKV